MKRIVPAILVVLTTTATLAQEPSANPPATSPCKLLTAEDVSSTLGGHWQVWQDMGSEEVCVFQSSPTSMVTLTLYHDPMGAEKILQVRRELAGDIIKPMQGLGAGAFRLEMSSANSIAFGKGQTVARIEVSRDASSDVAVIEKFAQLAYGRLP